MTRLRIFIRMVRCEDSSQHDLSMPANVELRLASQMLQVLLPQSHTRIAAEREADVQHALDVARMLMRGFAASGGLQRHKLLRTHLVATSLHGPPLLTAAKSHQAFRAQTLGAQLAACHR